MDAGFCFDVSGDSVDCWLRVNLAVTGGLGYAYYGLGRNVGLCRGVIAGVCCLIEFGFVVGVLL